MPAIEGVRSVDESQGRTKVVDCQQVVSRVANVKERRRELSEKLSDVRQALQRLLGGEGFGLLMRLLLLGPLLFHQN